LFSFETHRIERKTVKPFQFQSVFLRWAPNPTSAGTVLACLAFILPQTASPFVIAVQQGINCNGNSTFTDSFNSSNPSQSDNGRYPIGFSPPRTSTNGDVACLAGVAELGGADINGGLSLGPNAAYVLTNYGAILGGVQTNLNYAFPEVVMPLTPWLAPITTNLTIAATIGTNIVSASYTYVFGPGAPYPNGSGYYMVSGGSGSIYVSNVNVTLLIKGSAAPNYIEVAGSGTTAGSLTIYMDGPSFSIAGASSVEGGNAASLKYYGTTNNTQITFGNASYTGTIYAPQADFNLVLGGSKRYDFVGASVTKSLTVNGNFNFHFDENLQRLGLCSPQIVAQPQDQKVAFGHDATFNVSAVGVVSYQWFFNGTNIPGATGSSLTITNATTSGAGRYSVSIASPLGIQTSSEASLTVLQPPPVISSQPVNTAAVLGGSVSFSVLAHGTEPLNYQWRANGVDVSGATGPTLILSPVQQSDFASYSVLVTNADGSILSDPALLSPAVPPPIGPVSINLTTLTLAFPTQVGPTYVVEYKFDLADASWHELTRISGTGQTLPITDNVLTGTKKFYRVRLQ
jgi:hypothetical protein